MSLLIPDSPPPIRLASFESRRIRNIALLAVGLAIVIGTLATGIVLSQREARSHVLASFAMRGTSSATFVSTFLYEQANHRQTTAREFLSGRHVSPQQFRTGVVGSTLVAFVDHTIAYPQHNVYLVDQEGRLVAASPRTPAGSLRQADPKLARAVERASSGPVAGAHTPSTFTTAAVPGTGWRLVIAVPNSKLFSSITGWSRIVPWLVFAMVSIFAMGLLVLFTRLTGLSERMTNNARTDSLTGLANRRALDEHLVRATAHARRHRKPIAVLMIDLDRFKQTNDKFGHAAGDRVLCAVADCMRDALRRGNDVYGRWGGDEFLVLLQAGNPEDPHAVAERLRAAARTIRLADIGLADGVHMSIGTASASSTTPDEIVHQADLALYIDKTSRRSTTTRQRGTESAAIIQV